jgi:DNA gyrase subunit B
VRVDLTTRSSAEESAARIKQALNGADIAVRADFDEKHERQRIILERNHHGNLRSSAIDEDFLVSGDYKQIEGTAKMLEGLVGDGAVVRRGEKQQSVPEFQHAMRVLLAEVERSATIQRYKGLGEMNPSQLWETTMDPTVRRLMKVQIDDGIAADEIFTKLMGDEVEPRRAFIEQNALVARLDV